MVDFSSGRVLAIDLKPIAEDIGAEGFSLRRIRNGDELQIHVFARDAAGAMYGGRKARQPDGVRRGAAAAQRVLKITLVHKIEDAQPNIRSERDQER